MRSTMMRTVMSVCGSLMVSTAIAGPKLEVAEPIFQFGQRERGETVEHTFVLKNTGDEPLSITRVQASCGCTSTQLAGKEVPPGKETKLDAKLSLKFQSGPLKRTILIETNDPVHPQTIVSLVGVAHSRMKIEPPALSLKAIVGVSEALGTVEVKGIEGLKFNITKIETSDAKVAATVAILKPGEAYRVSVEIKPPFEEGLLRGWVRLQTDQEGEYPLIVIPVSAVVAGDLAIFPRKLEFRTGTYQPAKVVLAIGPGKVQKFKVSSVDAPPSMTAATRETSDGYQVVLTNIHVSNELDGKELKINTDIDGGKVITVPIRVLKGGAVCPLSGARSVRATGKSAIPSGSR